MGVKRNKETVVISAKAGRSDCRVDATPPTVPTGLLASALTRTIKDETS